MTFNVALEGGGVMIGDRIDIASTWKGSCGNHQAGRR
jgi:hypothetical protein